VAGDDCYGSATIGVGRRCRHNLLTAALVGALLPAEVPEGHIVRAWLDSWSGAGHVVEAMHEQGYHERLMRSPFVWRAKFCRVAADAAPWRAVQRAALETLRQDATP
jgi:hypothetical protein